MPSTITATLQRMHENTNYINFYIRGQGDLELDFISIERRTKGKHKDKVCWSSATGYKAYSVDFWLFRLNEFGFDTAEFEQALIEMGWEKEVEDFWKEQDNLAEREAGDGEYN